MENYNQIEKELLKVAQEETDDSVFYNPFNGVVQSHKSGEQYVSIDKVLEFLVKKEFIKKID